MYMLYAYYMAIIKPTFTIRTQPLHLITTVATTFKLLPNIYKMNNAAFTFIGICL